MVVIRLSRGGAKKRPFYNIVATDRQNRRDGRFLERLGYYNPMASGADQSMTIELDRVEFWKSRGAQVSDAVSRLMNQHAKGGEPKPSKKKTRAMKKKEAAATASVEAEAAEAAEAASAEAADAPAADDGADAKKPADDKAAE